ncbi:hypothetical protein L596_007921 [Steinernema carpocapsae]|uniref:Uncharacterized protein n=1 Tax=Steinernema carpocapsae TaxID=34508 RepID=A0A4U5PAY6_STECR|nr:hypothetical protein L596_007921 [Steinernema carpocapsae]
MGDRGPRNRPQLAIVQRQSVREETTIIRRGRRNSLSSGRKRSAAAKVGSSKKWRAPTNPRRSSMITKLSRDESCSSFARSLAMA